MSEPTHTSELATDQPAPVKPGSLTYGKYLEVDTLLSLQNPRSSPAEHDEMLFIIIHQTYELWFKQLKHELGAVNKAFWAGDLYRAIAGFQRARTIMKTLVGQMDILETMTPLSFLSFRDRLDTASGFQSVQFREFEFMIGYRRPALVKTLPISDAEKQALTERLSEPSVGDYFLHFLRTVGATLPAEIFARDVTQSVVPNETVQAEINRLYRERPDVGILFELMADFDEGLQEWRYRHVKIVERTIGQKQGTGGSSGMEFLKASLFKPAFPDIWAARKFF